MENIKYTLIVVREDGVSHYSTYKGWFRESSSDRDFKEVSKDIHTIYAVVTVSDVSGASDVRREYIRSLNPSG